MLTRRGWALAISTAALVVAGLVVGIAEVYPVAASAVVVLAAAAGWVRLRRWDLHVGRRVHPLRIPAGGAARVDVAVTNAARRRSPLLAARDPFDGGRRVAEVALAPLAPGEQARTAYRLTGLARGIYAVGPLELALSDPFGLARRSRTAGQTGRLVVHPPIEELPTVTLAGGSERQVEAGSARVGPGGEFFAIREYRTGDDLRSVHWASTARRDDLMIRQEQAELEGRMVLVADLRAEVHDAYTLEAALGALASVADRALGDGAHVRLATTAGADSGFGTGPAHQGKLLDMLAAAHCHRAEDLSRPAVGGARAVLVTTAQATGADLGLLGWGGSRAPLTVVVVEGGAGPAGGDGLGSADGFAVVRVRAGSALAPAWARAARRGGVATGG